MSGKIPVVFVSADLAKSHVAGYTRKDGAFVKEHDDKRKAAVDLDAVARKHDSKMNRKATEWDHNGYEGKKIPAADVAGAPEFTHKQVYGHDRKTSPAGDDFHPDFAQQETQHFVLKHPDGKRSFVDTQGAHYARYHAPIDDAKSDDPTHPDNWDKRGGRKQDMAAAKEKEQGPFTAAPYEKGSKVRVTSGVHSGKEATVKHVHAGAGVGGDGVHAYGLDIPGSRGDASTDIYGHNDVEPVGSKPLTKSLIFVTGDLAKAHVDSFTRKDGTVVQAHDDGRAAAQAKPTGSAALAKMKNVGSEKWPMHVKTSEKLAAKHADGSTHHVGGFKPPIFPAGGGATDGDTTVHHEGKTYHYTGKSGKSMKTGEDSYEFGAGESGEHRAWVTRSGHLQND